MNIIKSNGLILSIIFCVVLVSWYSLQRSKILINETKTLISSVDAHINNLTVQQFDVTGKEQHYLYTKLAQRVPSKQQHILQQPSVIWSQQNSPLWKINADSAIASHNGQEIMFIKHVILSRESTKLNDGMLLYSDEALFNQQTHLGVFTGHVKIDQDDTHINAAEARVEVDAQNKLQSIKLTGSKNSQVHYAKNQAKINAHADVMQYFPNKHMIQFIGNAKLQQNDDFFAAPMIMYDTVAQHIISSSKGMVRTTIVIHPENYS